MQLNRDSQPHEEIFPTLSKFKPGSNEGIDKFSQISILGSSLKLKKKNLPLFPKPPFLKYMLTVESLK
jgi:hypothetical protein